MVSCNIATAAGSVGQSSFGHNGYHVLIGYYVAKANTLGDMTSAGAPDKAVLESLFQRTVDLVTDILDG